MCGIFAILLAKAIDSSDEKQSAVQAPVFSWRNLWNQLYTIKGRGPDNMQLKYVAQDIIFGFQRLRINDTSEGGDQPLVRGKISVICNGEIYNYKDIKDKYGFEFESGSDCEILLHLYERFGSVEAFIDELDGVFAFVLHDATADITYVGRDPIGVRPIFFGRDTFGSYMFASEAKALNNLAEPCSIQAFPAGSFWSSKTEEFTKFWNPKYNLEEVDLQTYDESEDLKTTANLLYQSVIKRMLSDRPIGTFLSGGLDSSLVAAFIMKHLKESGKKPQLNTFSVGLEGSPDLAYSEIVANHIASNHHHVQIEMQDCLNAIEDVVYATETYDVTTIRASTPMYILSRYIRDNTEDVVIYSGEGADEVTQGYLYFKKQPTSREGALESQRLMEQLYEFDVLRVDRTTASHGLEVREPFLDKAFMKHYFALPSNVKCPRNGIEKYHLRKAISVVFPGLIPDEILWRQKEAFSDGVSSFKKKSWVDELKDLAEVRISDDEFEKEQMRVQPTPKFKDALYLRRIYDKFYGTIQPPLVSKYWIPQWCGENPDSSARKLAIFNEKDEDQKLRSSIKPEMKSSEVIDTRDESIHENQQIYP